jgi:nitrilase
MQSKFSIISGPPVHSIPVIPTNTADGLLTLGLAQIAQVWLDRTRTLEKVCSYVEKAAQRGCNLVAFGEALAPGYPFWLELTDGARFNSSPQKQIFAEYARQAVQIESGHLDSVCAAAARHRIAVYLGSIERPADRGGHSLYCSLVYIGPDGAIGSAHGKLMPTKRRAPRVVSGRLSWPAHASVGRVPCGRFELLGESTRFIALESRSYVGSVSGLMRRDDIGGGAAW